jgi:Dolichyl-phosphate-mannose-protein mannosyltransferase
MGFVWFSLGSVLVAATSLLFASSLRLGSAPSFLLGAYLLATAELVALAEVLSPFHAVTRLGYLTAATATLLAAVALWWARGRPRPPLPTRRQLRELHSQPLLMILAGVVFLALVYEFVVGVTTPPDNWDSLWHHLVRAALWRQDHSVGTIWNSNVQLGLNADPPNAELQILFGLVLLGRDTLATLPQLFAECALLVAVFGMARRVGFAREASVFAALLTATLSQVALQSVTTQNDLVVAAAVAAAGYFILGHSRTEVILAGVAVGLALGTKLTAAFALPALALIALAAGGTRRVARLAAWSALGFVAFGTFIYLRSNGAASTVADSATTVSSGGGGGSASGSMRAAPTLVGPVSTAARVLYGFIDFSGFQHVFANETALIIVLFTVPLSAMVIARRWAPAIALAASVPLLGYLLSRAGIGLFALFHIPANPRNATTDGVFVFGLRQLANENVSYFGPVGMLLLWPVSVWGCVAWARHRLDRRAAALALALPIYVVAYAATLSWDPVDGRYFISAVALAMPLAALAYRKPLFARTLTIVGIAALFLVHAFNQYKPTGLAGTKPIWSLSRIDALTLEEPRMRPVLRRVAKDVPKNAHVGVVLDSHDWTYPFFGAQLGRTVTYLKPSDARRMASAEHISYIIVHRLPWHWRIIKLAPKGSDGYAASPDTGSH